MIFRNKLIRTDLLLLITAILLLASSNTGSLRGILEGAWVATLFLSVLNHIQHFQQTKKLY